MSRDMRDIRGYGPPYGLGTLFRKVEAELRTRPFSVAAIARNDASQLPTETPKDLPPLVRT